MKEKKRRRAERKSVATAGGGLMFCSANTVKTEIEWVAMVTNQTLH